MYNLHNYIRRDNDGYMVVVVLTGDRLYKLYHSQFLTAIGKRREALFIVNKDGVILMQNNDNIRAAFSRICRNLVPHSIVHLHMSISGRLYAGDHTPNSNSYIGSYFPELEDFI